MADEIDVKLASHNAWFTPAQSNAYYAARYSREGVCVHWWGDGSGADNHDNIVNYFLGQAAAGIKSVNYVVSDRKITMMVDPDNVAWASNGGNPTTVSIEFQPTLGDEGYKRGGWLIAQLEAKYGHKMSLYGHNHWFNTSCPGSISLDRLRKEADAAAGGPVVNPTPAPTPAPLPQPAATQTVTLPATAQTWACYRVGSSYIKGSADQVGTLLPAKYGGLTYPIVQNLGNVVVIDTQSFGRVAIWVKDTDAVISGQPSPVQPVSAGMVTFPASAQTWAVYRVGSQYRKGTSDQVGTILPAKFGGLTYPIVQNLGNVVVIDTQSFGRVAAWIKDTEAILS